MMSRNVSPSLTSSSDFGPVIPMLVPRPPLSLMTTVRSSASRAPSSSSGSSSASGSVVDRLDLGLGEHARLARRAGARSSARTSRPRRRRRRSRASCRARRRGSVTARDAYPALGRAPARQVGALRRRVSSSISTPSDASFRRATSRSISPGTGMHARRAAPRRAARGARRTSAWLANDMSMTAAGWPSAAARFTTRPWASRFRRRPAELELLDERQHLAARDRRSARELVDGDLDVEVARRWRASRRPSCARSARARSTSRPPVTVMKTSPRAAASSAGMTSKPSIRASSARIGSTSQTITDAPAPARAQRDALAGPAVAEHDDGAPGEQQVRRAQDAVERRLAGAVAVVERALGARLVDGDAPGTRRRPSSSSARRRTRPVVVSSVPPMQLGAPAPRRRRAGR